MTGILPRIRSHGADAVIRDGRPVLIGAAGLPADLLAECRSRRAELVAKLYGMIVVPCNRCGAVSRPFIEVINPEFWQCDACLPDVSVAPESVAA